MKNISRFILLLTIGSVLSISAYSQGSGSTQSSGYQSSGTIQSNRYNPDFGKVQPTSFEVTKTIKASLVKVVKGRIFLKTKKGKLLDLKLTYDTQITNKKKGDIGLVDAKYIRVSYIPESSQKKEAEAVKIKVLN
jgi:hypothetical protein